MSPISTRQLLVQFSVAAVALLMLVAGVTVFATRRLALGQALHDAESETARLGVVHIEPALPAEFDPESGLPSPTLDQIVHDQVISKDVEHVRLWDSSGLILYSDQTQLIGTLHELDDSAVRAISSGEPESRVSDPEREEDEGVADATRQLEVYYAVTSANGSSYLFETYQPYEMVDFRSSELFSSMAPLALGSVLALFALQLPLTYLLVRRLDRAQNTERLALQSSIEATARERRAIAADLHDGTVQDLAGISMSLSVLADKANAQGHAEDASVALTAADATRRAVRSLRSLLVDLYPPNLGEIGLQQALFDLTSRSAGDTASTGLRYEAKHEIPHEATLLAYRAVRELLRNSRQHSGSSRILVTVRTNTDLLIVTVCDDGVGLDAPDDQTPDDGRPRLGLRSLSDLLTAAGGTLELSPGENGSGLTATATILLQ